MESFQAPIMIRVKMRQLREICSFRELGGPADAPSIREHISDVAQPDEERIVTYLENGVGLAGRAGYLRDVLDPSIVGLTSHTLTDGVYVWTSDLAYYVKKYHLTIPEEAVAHMKANHWTPPDEDDLCSENYSFE
jgi:hypothetical protein